MSWSTSSDDSDLPRFDDSDDSETNSDYSRSGGSSDYSDSDDDYRVKNKNNASGRNRQRHKTIDVEPLRFRDENPPTRWVQGLENIDTEEAAYELRQQVTDNILTTSTTRFDPLEVVNDTDAVFATLTAQQAKENDRNTYRSMKRHTKDAEIDITSLHFDPVHFLSRVHKSTLHQNLQAGLLKLATTVAIRSNNIKKLVRLHFGQFVHCKDTIDLIQTLLKAELPHESQRLLLLASRPHNLPFLLNTFTPKQHDDLYAILMQQFKKEKEFLKLTSLLTKGAKGNNNGNNTNAITTTSTTVTSINGVTTTSTSSSSNNQQQKVTGALGAMSINANQEQQQTDRSRLGRLQLALSTVAEKTDAIYAPLLSQRGESDRIRQALTTYRKYKLLLELPMKMRQHITAGRVDRLVHDTQRIKQIHINGNNPNNYLLFATIKECQTISFQYSLVLLKRLSDPRYNLYSQQRTMSYLYQLDGSIDPTWYFLERQTLHISNLLDRIYYSQTKEDTLSHFAYINHGPNQDDSDDDDDDAPASPQMTSTKLPTIKSNVDPSIATGGAYKFKDGQVGADELIDTEYDPKNPNSTFNKTLKSLKSTAPPTVYFEYEGAKIKKRKQNSNDFTTQNTAYNRHAISPTNRSTSPTNSTSTNNGNNNNGDEEHDETQFNDILGIEPLPLFLRKPRELTHAQAEFIATSLLHVFQAHIQPLLRLSYNVGNGSLFDTIKSALDGNNSTNILLTLTTTQQRSRISNRNIERLSTLINHLTSKLIIYLSSLTIPQLNLFEIDGLMTSIVDLEAQSQRQQKRATQALDLAFASNHPDNPVNIFSHHRRMSSLSSPKQIMPPTAGAGGSGNSGGDSPASNHHHRNSHHSPGFSPLQGPAGSGTPLLGPSATPVLNRKKSVYDDMQLPTRKSISGSAGGGGGANGNSSADDFIPPTREQLQLPFNNRVGLSKFSTFPTMQHQLTMGPSIGKQLQQETQKPPKVISYISSVTDEFIYTRQTPLHIVQFDPVQSVLPRHHEDPIKPIPVAPFSYVILHLLSNILVSLANNELIKYEPVLIDPILSFYCKLYQTTTQNLLISATVQITTLRENWMLSPQYIYSRANITTIPQQFNNIIDIYLQSMQMLPTQQLLFRGLLYLNTPPEFTMISNFTELILTFADRLHSNAIPQWPVRLMSNDAILDPEEEALRYKWLKEQQLKEAERKKEQEKLLILQKKREAITTTKVITKKTVIVDGKPQVFETEQILEQKPVTVVETSEMFSSSKEEENNKSSSGGQSRSLIDQSTGLITQYNKQITKELTTQRFGKEILSLAEQLNLNESTAEPYSISEVVSLNYHNIYHVASSDDDENDGDGEYVDGATGQIKNKQYNLFGNKKSGSSFVSPMATTNNNNNEIRGLTALELMSKQYQLENHSHMTPAQRNKKPEMSRPVAAATAGLVVYEKGQKITKHLYLSHFNSPGEDRMVLAILANTIYTTNIIIPQAWRNLSELVQRLWPAKELFEMSFHLSARTNKNWGGLINGDEDGAKQEMQRMRHNQMIRKGLDQLNDKYNVKGKSKRATFLGAFHLHKRNKTNTAVTTASQQTHNKGGMMKSLMNKSNGGKRNVKFAENDDDSDALPELSDSDDDSDDDDSDYTSDEDEDSDDVSSSDNDDHIKNILGIAPDIWAAMSEQKRDYINASVVGGLGVAMARALDNSYQRVIGIFLWLQTILSRRYIHIKLAIIVDLIHNALQCGGINWRKAPITTHIREYIYLIMQLLVETKSELLIYQNIDVHSIMSSIIEEMIVHWCSHVRKIHILSYNGAMQLYLETIFICRGLNRYTTPYAISLIRDLLKLLHLYIEETITSERVNTTAYTQAFNNDDNDEFMNGAGMALPATGDNGLMDYQAYDAVSRLGMFSHLQNKVFNNTSGNGKDNKKIDENTGYEISTTVSPLQSMIMQSSLHSAEMRAARRAAAAGQNSVLSKQSSLYGNAGNNGSTNMSISNQSGLVSSDSLITSALMSEEKRNRSELQRARQERSKLKDIYGEDFISSKRDSTSKSKSSKNNNITQNNNNKSQTQQQQQPSSSSSSSEDDEDDEDGTISDGMYDDLNEDDEAGLVSGMISMKELKSYTTQQVNKDLMIQFKLHNSQIDINNILQHALRSTRLSFATLRIDPDDPLNNIDSSISQSKQSKQVRTPIEVIDGYFKVRRNASRLRENQRIERSQSELQKQKLTKEWIKNNNYIFNSALNNDDDELYVNLSLGQSNKYHELIMAHRAGASEEVMRQIMIKYYNYEKETIQRNVFREKDYTEMLALSAQRRTVRETITTEQPPDFGGVKVTKVITKNVVEKRKEPKEKPAPPPPPPPKEKKEPKPPKEKKQKKEKKQEKIEIIEEEVIVEEQKQQEEEEVRHVEEVNMALNMFDSSEEEKPPTPKKPPTPPPVVIQKPPTPPPTPKPVKIPTPPPTPKPLIIEEQVIVTTTTMKEDQTYLEEERILEERRKQDEKKLKLLEMYSESNNLDMFESTTPRYGGKTNEFDQTDEDLLAAMNFSYKVKKKEKKKTFNFAVQVSEEEEEPMPQQPPTPTSSSSSSEEELPPPPKQRIIKQEERRVVHQQRSQPQEYKVETVNLQSNRQRRERTQRQKRQEDDNDGYQVDLGVAKTVVTKSSGQRAKKVDVTDLQEQQRLLAEERQRELNRKNTLKEKIQISNIDIMEQVREREGEEDITKLTFEEKRKRQIKMRIKRTKDGKYIDLDTGEEIDPSLFKKQLQG